jgi:hypothetical protein
MVILVRRDISRRRLIIRVYGFTRSRVYALTREPVNA